jgi:hypothetical protein
MKILTKIAGTFACLALALGLFGPIAVQAATSPNLGAAASYSVVAGSIVTNAGNTTVAGDLGVSPSIGVPPHVTGFPPGVVAPGTIHDAEVGAAAAQAVDTAAFTTLNQSCDATYAGVKDLTTLSPLGPGVYCADAFILTGNLNLTGSGVWIFKSASSLITWPASSVTGGDPCNIWWRVVSSATIDTTTAFEGNILALTSIGFNNGASLNGRAMAQTGAVTLNNNAISGPVCSVAPAPPSGSNQGLLTVVKTVVNDNGGAKTVADFPLFVNGTPVISGETNRFNASAQMYHVTETGSAGYASSFSGDCNASGDVLINREDTKVCIITNNDIGAPIVTPPVPPLIDVVKVPSPLALPNGPGAVTYTYTLKNIGTVPVANITMVGDTCSPIVLASGDTNGDAILQVNETWVYRCSTTLAETHTNTVTATGWANGISTTDIASATVVVGEPIIPPLIHVTKVPDPLAFLAGGGLVTYTEKITNPGTVALSSVALTDDKCAPVKFISGDTNGDSLLDPAETWVYTCTTKLTQTTTNTATASGMANGMTVRDFAIATVVVASRAVPALPKTGFDPSANGLSFIAFAAALAAVSLLFYAIQKKIVA